MSFHFSIVQVHFGFGLLNFIKLYPYLSKHKQIMFITIIFLLGSDRPSRLLFVPVLLLSILTPLFSPSSSVSLSYFILPVPMRECLGKHSCMSPTFPIVILNGTCFFCQCNYKCTACIRSEKLETVKH